MGVCAVADRGRALTIRRFGAADHDAVWAVHNLALHQVGAHAGSGPWDDDLHHVEEVYLRSGGEFLVGECGGQVVAMGALRRVSDAEAKVIFRKARATCNTRARQKEQLKNPAKI